MQLGPIRQTVLTPQVDSKYRTLLPDPEFTPVYAEIDIDDVSSSIPNALRRMMMIELSPIGLYCDGEIQTNDKYISHVEELLRNRVLSTPIRQDTPHDAVFTFDVKNDGDQPLDVTYANLRGRGKIPCEKTAVLFTLQPRTWLKATLRVNRLRGDQRGNGARSLACQCASVARGVELRSNMEPAAGVSASTTPLRNWTLRFTTVGTATPAEVIRAAASELISRLQAQNNAISVTQAGDEWHMHIDGTYTISKLIEQRIYDLHPEVEAVCANVDARNMESTLRIKMQGPVDEIIGEAIESLISVFRHIAKTVK